VDKADQNYLKFGRIYFDWVMNKSLTL